MSDSPREDPTSETEEPSSLSLPTGLPQEMLESLKMAEKLGLEDHGMTIDLSAFPKGTATPEEQKKQEKFDRDFSAQLDERYGKAEQDQGPEPEPEEEEDGDTQESDIEPDDS